MTGDPFVGSADAFLRSEAAIGRFQGAVLLARKSSCYSVAVLVARAL